MCTFLRRTALLLALVILTACMAGCADLSRMLLSEDAPPLPFPVVAPAPAYRAAAFDGPGQWIEVAHEEDDAISFHDPDLANLLLAEIDAGHTPPEMHTGCPMTNTVRIYSRENELLASFLLAGDGDSTAALDAESPCFQLSGYAYGLLENQMWRQTRTLWGDPLIWDPTSGTAALELRLGHILNTLSVQAYGQMDGYFSSYTLYEPDVSEDRIYVYMIRGCACYAAEEDTFLRTAYSAVPARLTLEHTAGNAWAVTGYKECDMTQYASNPNAAVQAVFPYEMVEQVVYDMKSADFSGELHQLAMDHLRKQGLGRMTITE